MRISIRGIGSISPLTGINPTGRSSTHVSQQQRKFWVVILAGGDGRRLGSLTINTDGVSASKQYCSLNGGTSLLQLSLQRALRLVPRERIVLVVTEARRRCWQPNLFALRRSSGVPSNRGTGLGILLPLPSDRTAENENMPTLGNVTERTRFRFWPFVPSRRFRSRDATSAVDTRGSASAACPWTDVAFKNGRGISALFPSTAGGTGGAV
jgi:hypothetical protein